MLYQRVNKRRIALIPPVVQPFVVGSYILASEALHDKHHHVFLLSRRVDRVGFVLVYGRVDGFHLSLVEIMWHLKHLLPYGADERERRVEHQCSLGGMIHILVGVAYRYGSYGRRGAASHAADA